MESLLPVKTEESRRTFKALQTGHLLEACHTGSPAFRHDAPPALDRSSRAGKALTAFLPPLGSDCQWVKANLSVEFALCATRQSDNNQGSRLPMISTRRAAER